jgi:hypothetical protein
MANPDENDLASGEVAGENMDLESGAVRPSGLARAYSAVGEGFKQPFQQTADVVHDIVEGVSKKGGLKELQQKYPPVGNVGDVLKQAYGSLNPVQVRRDESGAVDYPATFGATLGNLGAMLTMGKMGEGLRAQPTPEFGSRANALTRSLGLGKTAAVDFPAEFKAALPELEKASVANPAPTKVGAFGRRTDAIDPPYLYRVVADAFGNTDRDFNNKLGPIAQQPLTVQEMDQIAAELRSKKVAAPLTRDPADPDVIRNAEIDAAIDRYRRPMTLGQANEQRMLARDRLASFYKLNPSAAGSKMGSVTDLAINQAAEKALKDVVYDRLQNTYRGQVPDNYFRDLKRTQSALYNITDELKGRLNVLSNEQAKDFLDRLRPHSYMSTHGTIGMAVGGLGEAIYPEAKSAARNVEKGLTPPEPSRLPQLLISPLVNAPGALKKPEEKK